MKGLYSFGFSMFMFFCLTSIESFAFHLLTNTNGRAQLRVGQTGLDKTKAFLDVKAQGCPVFKAGIDEVLWVRGLKATFGEDTPYFRQYREIFQSCQIPIKILNDADGYNPFTATYFENAKAIRKYLIDNSSKRIHIISHSYGGLAVLHALLFREGPTLQNVVSWMAIQSSFWGTPNLGQTFTALGKTEGTPGIIKSGYRNLPIIGMDETTRANYMTFAYNDIVERLKTIHTLSVVSWSPDAELEGASGFFNSTTSEFNGSEFDDGMIPTTSGLLPEQEYVLLKASHQDLLLCSDECTTKMVADGVSIHDLAHKIIFALFE